MILAEHTGQPVERIGADTDRDFILTPEEAKAYGVVDEVVSRRYLAALNLDGPALDAAGGAGETIASTDPARADQARVVSRRRA